jgi:hypothetical protein
LANRLKERLEEELPGEQVFLEESWDLSYATFSQLISDAPAIAADLKQKRFLQKGRLRLRVDVPKPVTVSSRLVEHFSREKMRSIRSLMPTNSRGTIHSYCCSFFIRGSILMRPTTIFLVWILVSRAHLHVGLLCNFQDTRLLSTVCTKADPTLPLADATRLLSAIFFVNVWPEDADRAVPRLPSWLYLNPRATHRYIAVGLFRSVNIHGTLIDDFSNDDY